MKKQLTFLLALVLLLLPGCGTPATRDNAELTIACTTYPVYLLTQAVTEQVPDTAVQLVINQQVSCLHNYTLTMADMKTIEGADLLVINGAGLEDFLSDVLETRTYLDASQDLDLLWNDEEGETDPHLWLDPTLAGQMAQNIASGLSAADPEHQAQYEANAADVCSRLTQFQREMCAALADLPIRQLITFHDGFQYFAAAFDLPLLKAIEEEEGSEASAQEINETVRLVEEYSIPIIFTEVNGSDATAQAIARETGCQVGELTMLMDGPDDGKLSNYLDGLSANITAIVNGFAGEAVIR